VTSPKDSLATQLPTHEPDVIETLRSDLANEPVTITAKKNTINQINNDELQIL